MRLDHVFHKAKMYVLAGTISIMPTFANTATRKSGQCSAQYGIKAGETLKGLSKDTYKGLTKGKVILGNGKKTTALELQAQANKVGKSINAPKTRPLPVVDKNGKIVAYVKIYKPSKKGALSGKTIIVNSGHGGYNPKNGYFDPGTSAKDANNKLLEEWYKNQNFANEVIKELNANGAKVIYMQGHVNSIMNAKSQYQKADLFISIHCDYMDKNISGPTVIYKDENDKELATSLNKFIKQNFNWRSDINYRNLGVLRKAPKMPSILAELGNMAHKDDIKNLDSKTFREKFAKSVSSGVIDFFKPKPNPKIKPKTTKK